MMIWTGRTKHATATYRTALNCWTATATRGKRATKADSPEVSVALTGVLAIEAPSAIERL